MNLIKDGIRIILQHGELRSDQVHLLDRHRPQRHLWNRRVIPHHLLHPHLLHLQ